ncbi:cryptococcal mannosyltransferase 1-domain-containing protein [Mycena floridula]|nr:cryptococcal mannosyltransferase 1-domain-containing protein [Mycena floridula]
MLQQPPFHHDLPTPALLEAFDLHLAALGVPQHIVVGNNSILRLSKMDTAPLRIELLAARETSNDVFIEADSVLDLLGTQDGNYDMACGIDLAYWWYALFSLLPVHADLGSRMYDAWVLRDRLGHIASSLWPYLFNDEGKQAMMNDEPAAVFSCWNGIVAFRANLVLPDHLRNTNVFRRNHSISLTTFDDALINPWVITSYQWRLYFWFKYVVKHWLIVWWMKRWEAGSRMLQARTIIGDKKGIWTWDGGECQPVSPASSFAILD